MPAGLIRRDQLPDGRRAEPERRRQMPARRRMSAGPRRCAGLQPRPVRRSSVDGRLRDRRRTDLHRRLARPGRPARHLHHRRAPAVGKKPADHRVAAGLQRSGRQRHLPDDAEQLRRRSDHAAAPLRSGGIPPFEPVPSNAEASYTTPEGASGCAAVPFKPTIDATPQGDFVDSPEATTVNVGIPFDPNEPIANSYLKTAKVVLPEGTSLNPASANGLVPCTDAQFGKGTDDPIACPAASKIGTVEVQTPSLPADSLTGTVYVAQPKSKDPTHRRTVPDLHLRRLGKVRGQRPPGREGLPEPEHRSADSGRRRQPAGDVQLLQAPLQRRAEGDADQPADLRPAHDQHGADAVVGDRRTRLRPAPSR